MNVTLTECDSEPLVPVTVTTKVPVVVKVHESVEVPDAVMVVGVRVHAALLADRLTTPVNPLIAVTVMVEVPAAPTLTVTLVGLADIVKSGAGLTVTVTVVL